MGKRYESLRNWLASFSDSYLIKECANERAQGRCTRGGMELPSPCERKCFYYLFFELIIIIIIIRSLLTCIPDRIGPMITDRYKYT